MTDRNPSWMWRLDLSSMSEQAQLAKAWFADGVLRRTPGKSAMHAEGPEGFLTGWVPSEPLIGPETRVIAFGSCFAARFAEWLAEHGYNRAFDSCSDESIVRNQLETPSAVAQQFRWAFGELDPDLAFWVGPGRRRFEATEERRLLLRDTLARAEVLIITLGISELWFDTVSGEPIGRVPPRELRGANRYAFKVASAAESIEALETIHRLRLAHMPGQKILYTISPQRHNSTFRRISPIVASVVSKAVLRVGVDEFLRAHAEELNRTYFYFPAYEIVTELLRDPFEADNRHLRHHHAAFVLDLFARHYTSATVPPAERPCFPASPEDELHETIAALEAQTATLQKVCDERLAVIERLQAACDERLAVIERLDAEIKRTTELDPQLHPRGLRLAESVTRLAARVLGRHHGPR